MATVVGVLALFLLGLSAAHAARLELAAPSLTAVELSGCGQAVVYVRALDSGDGVVVTGLPEGCSAGTLGVQVRSGEGQTVFTGSGPIHARTDADGLDVRRTTVTGDASGELLSSINRQASVWVDGWPLAALWLPSGQELGVAPFSSAAPRIAVANVGWRVVTPWQFCAVAEVVNQSGAPVSSWEVAVDLSAAPFHWADTPGNVQVNPSGSVTRIEDGTLYIGSRSWRPRLAPGAATTIEVCEHAARPRPQLDPGPDTYSVSSTLTPHRDATTGALTRVSVELSIADNRSGLFWIGWYAILDWRGLLAEAETDGLITSEERAALDARGLNTFSQVEGPAGNFPLTRLSEGHAYRIVGEYPVDSIAPGVVYRLVTDVYL